MMESTKVERRGCGAIGDPGPWADARIAGPRRLADFIPAEGAVPWIRLGHSGRKAPLTRPWEGRRRLTADHPEMFDREGRNPVGSSAVAHGDRPPTPRALSRAEIRELVVHWGEAAAHADAAGFDVLEIRGAHGHLVHQFLPPTANRRDDDHGGADTNCMRFAPDVATAVHAGWPAEAPLFMRLSREEDAGWGPAQNVVLARALKRIGVDVIDRGSGGMMVRSPISACRDPPGFAWSTVSGPLDIGMPGVPGSN
jgi:2,4-dienoyl-CoA reductase-like NADH-dependent reductase (Old Yellow Enzyme family)